MTPARRPKKSPFATISRLGPTQQVQSQLLTAINNGEYEPGTALPSERAMCEIFGVSRVSIREALAGLAATGLIDVQQGKGAFVRPRVNDEYVGPFGMYIEMHREELGELLRVRAALDGLAASDAAQQATDAACAEIRRAHEELAAAVKDSATPQEITDLDVAFHQTIAEAGDGTLLPNLLRELNALLIESRHILFARPGQPQRSIADHGEILHAIVNHDAISAQNRAADHVKKMWSWVEQFRSSNPAG